MNQKVFALIDCNNFFVSCERVFNPKLENVPVIVASNNDGCAVARSNEVKEIGIKMGVPLFKVKDLLHKHCIKVLSPNFALYSDMSHRVMEVLRTITDKIEVYSIDEAFLSIESLGVEEYEEFGRMVKDKVFKWTGIPVSIGIAHTKTLAKAASELAKKKEGGVVDLVTKSVQEQDVLLQGIPVGDVWGIGYRLTPFYESRGIMTAYDYKYADLNLYGSKVTVGGRRTQLELQGISCNQVTTTHVSRKSIISSRSFGKPVYTQEELSEAISEYIGRAARKLRSQNLLAGYLTVYLTTGRFKKARDYYAPSTSTALVYPTSYTPDLVKAGLVCLEKIYRPGYQYKKAGVCFTSLQTMESMQFRIFDSFSFRKRMQEEKLMATVDKLNKKWGQGVLKLASEGTNPLWQMKQSQRSPRYTTAWKELLQISV
ncbi:Y-family DNA polymerase [Candidatus Dojkabacteria bacterium]|uniref:Y-family DNA polymerase n=1 Tax=Candidatus Dojkabacteria bacterium TaxID=2099670 RepID=A0A955L868_9BACT|nr:Y-family DNA polymerase [Candidatus Dojkabacteria bacterium]